MDQDCISKFGIQIDNTEFMVLDKAHQLMPFTHMRIWKKDARIICSFSQESGGKCTHIHRNSYKESWIENIGCPRNLETVFYHSEQFCYILNTIEWINKVALSNADNQEISEGQER